MRLSSAFCCLLFLALPVSLHAGQRTFNEFDVVLPEGWDGDERAGFSSGDRNEYMLVLTRKDAANERHLAQASIFLLPNRPGADARDFARQMAEIQNDATEPVKEGMFWTFSGAPRNNAVRGRGITRVNASREWLLIIITQDPDDLGAETVVASLRGATARARALLGR